MRSEPAAPGQIPTSGRLLAIDYGEKRVGLAISDPLQITAQPHLTLHGSPAKEAMLNQISEICTTQAIVAIILGMPLNMDGSAGAMAETVQAFADKLQSRTGHPVHLVDERLTSVQAQRILRELNPRKAKSKAAIDQMAATLILRHYLDSRRP